MKIQILFISFLICCTNLLRGQESAFSNSGTFIDPRDGHTYKTVKIGSQTWMAENLAYKAGDYKCWAYDDSLSRVDEYGYLYTWRTARNVCPSGWRLPSDSDWDLLINFLGGEDIAGGKMKEAGTSSWDSPNDGATNESDFSALPAGDRVFTGRYMNLGTRGQWWSSSEMNFGTGYSYCVLYNHSQALKSFADERYGLSVRCLKKPVNHAYDYLNTKELRERLPSYYDASLPGLEKLVYGNGTYKGQVQNGIPNGIGIFTFNTGQIYEGHWVDDKYQGKGKYIFTNGDVYSGEFYNDMFHGRGIYIYETGQIYDGEWKDGLKNGKGILKYPEGQVYEGEFGNDELNGYGKYTNLEGDISEGMWQNGELVSPE